MVSVVTRLARGGESRDIVDPEDTVIGTDVNEELMAKLARAREARLLLQEKLRDKIRMLEEKTQMLEAKQVQPEITEARDEPPVRQALPPAAPKVQEEAAGALALQAELLARLERNRELQQKLRERKRELEAETQQRKEEQLRIEEKARQEQAPAAPREATEATGAAEMAVEAVEDTPFWARIAVAAVGTYTVLMGTVFKSSQEPAPAASGLAGTVNVVPVQESSVNEGMQKMVDMAGGALDAAKRTTEVAARTGLHVFSAGLGFAADNLPAAGDAVKEASSGMIPAFQEAARFAADSSRNLADHLTAFPFALPAETPKAFEQIPKHMPGILNGMAFALDGVAKAAPDAHRSLAEHAGRAVPVVEAALRASSELSGAAAELRF